MDIIKLKKLVLQEIENLKIYATYEEIGKLDFETFNPVHTKNCIYGQMTGDCFSPRAVELLDLCATPFSHFTSTWDSTEATEFRENRNPNKLGNVFSTLEYYIDNYSETNEQIIAYLKGDSKTIEL
jgi:hypothetical protein